MTYNIHHGEGVDGKIDLLRISEMIARENPDLVALQEVDKGVLRTQRRDFPEELAALTRMTCIFSNNFSHQGGEYGNAILTKLPILKSANSRYQSSRNREQRGLLHVTVEFQGEPLVFMNTHIDYRSDDTERLASVVEAEEIIRNYAGSPIILCGDFNDVPDSAVHVRLKEHFRDVWEMIGNGSGLTYSSEHPAKRIDYIWISKDQRLRPLRVWVEETPASDHLPLVADLEWLPRERPQ